MNARQFYSWAVAMNKMGRPFLAAVITLLYNLTLMIALIMGQLKVQDYIMAVGPVNGIIVGFWFSKRENKDDEVEGPPTPELSLPKLETRE